jgi:hypothetical protein
MDPQAEAVKVRSGKATEFMVIEIDRVDADTAQAEDKILRKPSGTQETDARETASGTIFPNKNLENKE